MLKDQIILHVKNLGVTFNTEAGRIRAVDDVCFTVKKGKTLGIVGESGCGKSATALSIMRLLPKPSGILEQGQILFMNKDIAKLSPDEIHKIRGKHISMVFQEPMTALNPVHKIGNQLKEVFELHFQNMSKNNIKQECINLLTKVGIPDPHQRILEYPHQISGGMRQRVMIAMALAGKPDILIADEPTTALDVTIQAQILKLMKDLQQETNMAIIFITHDLGVIAEMCDHVVVMYAGKTAETANVHDIFNAPAHPYTKGLLSSIVRLETPRKRLLNVIKGRVPNLNELPDGCRFQNRCPYSMPVCEIKSPPIREISQDHFISCWLYK